VFNTAATELARIQNSMDTRSDGKLFAISRQKRKIQGHGYETSLIRRFEKPQVRTPPYRSDEAEELGRVTARYVVTSSHDIPMLLTGFEAEWRVGFT
jgi:hypothetical protein